MRPGVAERLGIGPEAVLAANPAIAYGEEFADAAELAAVLDELVDACPRATTEDRTVRERCDPVDAVFSCEGA